MRGEIFKGDPRGLLLTQSLMGPWNELPQKQVAVGTITLLKELLYQFSDLGPNVDKWDKLRKILRSV